MNGEKKLSELRFAAVVFDLNGTLFDSLADTALSANLVLERLGVRTHPVENYRRFAGDGIAMVFMRALPEEMRSPETVAQCVAQYDEIYGKNWNVHSKAYRGIPELLSAVSSMGVRMAVLSNKSQSLTDKCIEQYFHNVPFEVVLGKREGMPLKPHPAGALEISQRLKINSDACAYLGDTAVEVQTARAAAMFPVGALWGYRSRDELFQSGAAALIAHPLALLPILNAGRGET